MLSTVLCGCELDDMLYNWYAYDGIRNTTMNHTFWRESQWQSQLFYWRNTQQGLFNYKTISKV